MRSAMPDKPTAEDRQRAARLAEQIDKLRPLARKLGKLGPHDWRAGPGRDEPGQTFAEYLREQPVRPIGKRRVLYIQPLGEFTPTQRKIVDLTADFMGRYFSLPVKVQKDLPLSVIPQRARRVHPEWGVKQVLTTYVLDEVLVPRLPKDAAACIAFTASDLWPGRGWNFVFGQASLRQRVGVWSIYRNGEPDRDPAAFRLCLLRTIKTATHETGHMFSMRHCTAYECNMCGSNHRQESDRRPIACCPECVAKVCWATRTELLPRYGKLLEFARTHGLKDAAETYEKSIKALGGTVEAPEEPPKR
jgi:archaemetzincin